MSVKKCVIPIAGKGTRFLPITKTISKEMLTIVNKPSILLQVIECYKSGIEEVIFVLSRYNYHLVKSFFTVDQELNDYLDDDKIIALLNELNEVIDNVKFHYVLQDESLRGTAGAIYAARDYIKDESFGVIFGDDLIKGDVPALSELIKINEEFSCNVVGVGEVSRDVISNYGVVKYKDGNIVDTLVEKPTSLFDDLSNHAIQGRYVISSDVFDYILNSPKHKNSEVYIGDVLLNMSQDIRTCLLSGDYYDIGSHFGFIKANIAYGLSCDYLRDKLLEYISEVK